MARKYIGEILVEEGFIEPEHLEEALREQKRQIGQILVDKGFLKKEDLDRALKVQVGITRWERYSRVLRGLLVVLLVLVVVLSIQFFRLNERAGFMDRLEAGELSFDELEDIIARAEGPYQMEALRSIGHYPPRQREELLIVALRSPSWYVRLYGALFAQRHGGPRLVPFLIPLTLKEEEPVVRFAATESLEKLTGSPGGMSFQDWLDYAKTRKLKISYPAWMQRRMAGAGSH